MAPYPTDHARPAVPFLVATAAIMVFTTMDGVVKSLPATIPVMQIVAMRFAFGIPMVLAAMRLSGGVWPSLASWKANAPRGLLSMASTLLFFTALRHLPFAEALSLSYVGPLMVALIAAAVLGERLRLGVIGPILLGLAGVGVIAHDSLTRHTGLSTDLIGIAAAIGSALTYAIGNVLLRSQAQRDHATSIVLIQHIVPTLLATPLAIAGWEAPSTTIWMVFPLLALFGVTGHFLLVWAFGRAPAGVLAVVDYLALPYAALIGFLFFGEIPTAAMWLGAAFIVAACLIVTRQKKQAQKQAQK